MTKKATSAGESQLIRFQNAARELGADESEAAFDKALRKVGSAKPSPKPKPDKSKPPK